MRSLALRNTDFLDEFDLPASLEANGPPELRGLPRDHVPLMVAESTGIRHRRFHDIGAELAPGDLLVVNNSATLPAAVAVSGDRVVHFSTTLPGGLRVVEVRRRLGSRSEPILDLDAGRIALPGDAALELLAPFPVGASSRRLWAGHVEHEGTPGGYLERWGEPISYTHAGEYSLDAYQTVFAAKPGSAEMPSAGRPFTSELVASLVAKGVGFAPLTLHTGVSSLESGEAPYPEWYEIPAGTAAAINDARERDARVVAVGTTVVRALETVVAQNGEVHPGQGWSDHVIGPDSVVRSIDGLITGWHEPKSTHLDMLQAVTERSLLAESYRLAVQFGYMWHEFGDSHLILRT